MRINSSDAPGWWAAVLLPLVLSLNVIAKDKEPYMIVQGTVFLIDKASSTIMVDTKTGARRVVVYSRDTTFSYGRNNKGKESSLDEVQKAQYISCTGMSDDGARLVIPTVLARFLLMFSWS